MNPKKWAWKQILVTFAVSFVLGTAFGRWEYSNLIRDKWKDPHAKQKWILKRLDATLNLDAGQEEQVAVILKETAPKKEAIRAKVRPEMDAVKQEARGKIMAVLNAGQQEKYAKMQAEWDERKRRYRESLAASNANA